MAMKFYGTGSSTVELTPEDERLTIRDITVSVEGHSKEGDTFYLITQRWWQHWIGYVNQDQQYVNNGGYSPLDYPESVGSSSPKRPCGIDNSDLLNDMSEDSIVGVELQDALVEGRDYVLLPEDVWNQLYTWYGGGPALARKAINSRMPLTELTVEVYPLRIHLYILPKNQHATIKISKKETIGDLHRRVCVMFKLDPGKVSIWDYYGRQKHALMNDIHKTLDETNIKMDQDILIEVQSICVSGGCTDLVHENGSVQRDTSFVLAESSKSCSTVAGELTSSKDGFKCISSSQTSQVQKAASLKDLDATYSISTRGAVSGLTGLLNMGNTCFMNSAIQCLVHTHEFASYFQEDFYQEINWQNPLGMVGELALAFGDLLRKLWAPGRTPLAPRIFKTKLARFAPQFSGYNQHDSQELLAFLLDGLHEDLNRVRDKPYIKSRDADGRPDEDVADEYWANHIARNDSIIVDVCQGQYKSTLICPVCNKISVTFDPFMYLSLPLQSTCTRMMTVTVFTCDGSALPAPCTVVVQKQGRCRDLIQALSSACSLKDNEFFLLAQIQDNLISHLLDPLVMLSTIKDDDYLAAYMIPKLPRSSLYMQLIHLHEEQDNAGTKTSNSKSFGTPLVSPIIYDDVITWGHLQLAALRVLSPFSRNETLKFSASLDMSGSTVSGEAHEDSHLRCLGQKLSLRLVGENSECAGLSMDDEVIPLAHSTSPILVYLEWSRSLLNDYDTSYMENIPEVLKFGSMAKKARSEHLSLYSCLEAFLGEEPLVPEDMWYCPECKEHRQASKKLDLWRLPQVLVVHLKRFSYSRSMKHKLETFINFPIHDFDLTSYVARKSCCGHHIYELYGLINHYGSMGSGHYTAHIKLLEENRWYTFDDSHISSINEDDIKSSAAYVLFYRRVATADYDADPDYVSSRS